MSICLDQNLNNKDYTILPKVTSLYSNIVNTKYFIRIIIVTNCYNSLHYANRAILLKRRIMKSEKTCPYVP